MVSTKFCQSALSRDCSKANTYWRKRTPALAPGAERGAAVGLISISCMRLRVWHGVCQYKWHERGADRARVQRNQFQSRRYKMFDGKNNRLLDSFSFRAALITAVVALWSGAGYVLLALA